MKKLMEVIVCDKCGKKCITTFGFNIFVKIGESELCYECALKEIESEVQE